MDNDDPDELDRESGRPAAPRRASRPAAGRFSEEWEPSPIAPAADGGPAPLLHGKLVVLQDEDWICLRGPCRNYHRLVTSIDAQKPLPVRAEDGSLSSNVDPAAREPRATVHTCYPSPGIEMPLNDAVVYECNLWDPIMPSSPYDWGAQGEEAFHGRQRRRDAYREKEEAEARAMTKQVELADREVKDAPARGRYWQDDLEREEIKGPRDGVYYHVAHADSGCEWYVRALERGHARRILAGDRAYADYVTLETSTPTWTVLDPEAPDFPWRRVAGLRLGDVSCSEDPGARYFMSDSAAGYRWYAVARNAEHAVEILATDAQWIELRRKSTATPPREISAWEAADTLLEVDEVDVRLRDLGLGNYAVTAA